MFGYLILVIMLSMPASYVTSLVLRAFAQYDEFFYFSYVKETLFELTELVEKRIGAYMQEDRGAIVHDDWKFN